MRTPATKGASKHFMILESAIEGDVEQNHVMDQQPEPHHMVLECLVDQPLEARLLGYQE